MTFYKCLKCGKIIQSAQVRPHLRSEHGIDAAKLVRKERLLWFGQHYDPPEHDYFHEGELVAVCLGFQDPSWLPHPEDAVRRYVATAQEYWKSNPRR